MSRQPRSTRPPRRSNLPRPPGHDELPVDEITLLHARIDLVGHRLPAGLQAFQQAFRCVRHWITSPCGRPSRYQLFTVPDPGPGVPVGSDDERDVVHGPSGTLGWPLTWPMKNTFSPVRHAGVVIQQRRRRQTPDRPAPTPHKCGHGRPAPPRLIFCLGITRTPTKKALNINSLSDASRRLRAP